MSKDNSPARLRSQANIPPQRQRSTTPLATVLAALPKTERQRVLARHNAQVIAAIHRASLGGA